MKISENKNDYFGLGRLERSNRTKLAMRVTGALLATLSSATWCLFAVSNTVSIKDSSRIITTPNAPNATPFVDIGSTGPLNHIYLGNELSCQVAHILDGTVREFYPPGTIPGDCGTFIAMNGTLYAPNFNAHGGTATNGLGPRVVFTPISQTPFPTGAGTAAAPFQVVTVVGVGPTGLSIQQTDTYIVGEEFYRTEIMLINSGGPASGVLYRAGDAYLGGSDSGYGFTSVVGNRKSVGCSSQPNNVPPGRVEQWIPLTGDNNFYHNTFDSIWNFIGTKAPFPDTCMCPAFQDNGAGISWNFNIPAGGSATFSLLTNLSPLGLQPLVVSKKADSPTSVAGLQNGYTITIENGNPSPVTLSSITDKLPVGFSYISGSTSGVTTGNPFVSGQTLRWSGPFVVAANGSVSLHFTVMVSNMAGDYLNEAGGEADGGYSVSGTGPTAPITVTPCPGTIFAEYFDGLPAPHLPNDWVTTNASSPPTPVWETSTTNPSTRLNAAFVAAPSTVSDHRLETPGIAITSQSTQVSFRNNFDLQSGFDGGVLEVSSPNINGGAFTDILAVEVGGSFVIGGYNTIISSVLSPIAGRMAWSGYSCGYLCTVANLGPKVNGNTIKLRVRLGTDSSVASPGWSVDTFQVLESDAVCGPCVPPTLIPEKLLNISARAFVGTGGNVLIGGFIITGNAPKRVVLRGIGPSLTAFGITDPLADPTLQLFDSDGNLLLMNDDWRDSQDAEITATGLAPTHDRESGMVITLPPCAAYTAIVAGRNGGTGVGMVEIYDINQAVDSELANLSARGFVGTGNNVMIGGFILGGSSSNSGTRVAVRGIGPTLFLNPSLEDPTISVSGASPSFNDNWQDHPVGANELTLQGLELLDPSESGIFTSLSAGAFTAILAGQNEAIGLVEIYNVH
jgi:uncharacterized repeat protein (TIGR01451 family)